MSEPRSYPEDQGPFDAEAETPAGEKTFTADDPAAPDAVQYDADQQDADDADELEQGDDVELDPLKQGDESNVDPDLGISQ
jgi:hypothetical protein